MSLARAKGLAESLASAPDDARIEGVREIGAEIATLLATAEAEVKRLESELHYAVHGDDAPGGVDAP